MIHQANAGCWEPYIYFVCVCLTVSMLPLEANSGVLAPLVLDIGLACQGVDIICLRVPLYPFTHVEFEVMVLNTCFPTLSC